MKKIVDKLAHRLAINQNLNLDQEEVISYGMQATLQMAVILLISLGIGFLTSTPIESLIIYLTVGIFRKFTGGAHGKSMLQCIIVSVLSISAMSCISRYIMSWLIKPNYFLIVFAMTIVFVSIIVYLKAPVESKNKPIRNPKKIKRLRFSSFIFISLIGALILLSYILYINNNNHILLNYGYAFCLSLIWQASTLVPSFFNN